MHASSQVIPDPKLRLRFKRAMSGLITEVPCLGLTATEAAFVSALLRRRRQPSLSCHYDFRKICSSEGGHVD